ncbi:hypothetical protein R1sor_024656 [Riccia sorocarpa]|uniref:Uncharacterized protein n=1 Tax=Riccia sorocarpa TaxID=122646 RepID=A0ABD3GUB8_9MARC
MGSQSRGQHTVDRNRTDHIGQYSRPVAQADEDRLSICKALKVGSIMSLKEQHAAKLLLANLANGRAQRSDILSAEMREPVLNWWNKTTRVSPIAKRFLKRQKHAIHTLDITQVIIFRSARKFSRHFEDIVAAFRQHGLEMATSSRSDKGNAPMVKQEDIGTKEGELLDVHLPLPEPVGRSGSDRKRKKPARE